MSASKPVVSNVPTGRESGFRSRFARGASKATVSVMSVMLAICLCPGIADAAEGRDLASGELAIQAGAAIDESEPNDGFDQATPISMNKTVYGEYDGYDKYDYYVVDLPVSGSVKFTFANDRYSNGGDFGTSIYNKYYEYVSYSNGDMHNRVTCSRTRPISVNVSLSKGKNYFSVGRGAWGGTPPTGQPYHFKLTYNIPSTTVKATASKRSIMAKWTKKSGAAKYQLRYSAKRNMSGAKTVDVSKAKGSKKITKLKSGKKYYVQVRVVKNIDGETYYSPWSSKKSAKPK